MQTSLFLAPLFVTLSLSVTASPTVLSAPVSPKPALGGQDSADQASITEVRKLIFLKKFSAALAMLEKLKGKVSPVLWQKLFNYTLQQRRGQRLEQERQEQEARAFAGIEEFVAGEKVKQGDPESLFRLLLKCARFKATYPSSSRLEKLSPLAEKYAGALRLDDHEPEWVEKVVREALEKDSPFPDSKRAYAVIRVLVKAAGGVKPAYLAQLEQQVTSAARAFGEKALAAVDELIKSGKPYLQLGDRQMVSLAWVITNGGIPEIVEKAKLAQGRLSEYLQTITLGCTDPEAKTQAIAGVFHSRIAKYEKYVPVQNYKPLNVYSLLLRCAMFKREFPTSPLLVKVAAMEKRYDTVVDFDNPELEWLVTAVHEPYYKSQHHKRFYLSFRILDYFRLSYGNKYKNVLGKLDEQTKKFAKMFGEREVMDGRALIQKQETFLPVINNQIRNLSLAVKYVYLHEQQKKCAAMLAELQAYRVKVMQK